MISSNPTNLLDSPSKHHLLIPARLGEDLFVPRRETTRSKSQECQLAHVGLRRPHGLTAEASSSDAEKSSLEKCKSAQKGPELRVSSLDREPLSRRVPPHQPGKQKAIAT